MTRTAVPSARKGIILAFLIWWTVPPAAAIQLVSEYSIPLKEKDRVLGSLQGNFLIYSRPDITMYNTRGREVFSRKLKNNVIPTMSPGGRHLGLVTYNDHSPTDLKTVKFEMYDQAGRLRWKLSDPVPNTFFITDSGTIFGVEGVEGISPTRLYLYDQFGDVINILVFKTYHGLEIAPSGRKFIVDKARGGLEVYDSLGTFLDTLPVSSNYVIDKDDRYIGVFFQNVFRLYQDEREVASINIQETVIRDMAIDVENNLVVFMAPKRLEIYELTTGRLLWEYRLIDGHKWFASLHLSDDSRFIACGVDINAGNQVPKEERHVEGFVYLFPGNGKTMFQHRETYRVWNSGLPRGVVSPSGGSLFVQTQEKLEKFRIK